MGRTISVLLIAVLLTVPIVARQLKVDVALVTVVATVTDDLGRHVPDLTEKDFVIYEDGKQQTISHFSQSEDLPVSMGVVLDTSGSMERKISTATTAVERFIRSVHRDDDIFLMTFSNRPIVVQNFTDDRVKLSRALSRVTVGGGTALYDAMELAVRKIKDGIHDKKAILLISDGEDTSSEASYEDALGAVRESEVLVYSLGITPTGGFMSERSPLPGGTRVPSGGGTTGPNGRRGPTTGGGGGGTGGTLGIPFPIPLPIPGGGQRPPRFPLVPEPQVSGRNGGTTVQVGRGGDTVDMAILDGFGDASGGKAFLLSGAWMDNRGREIQDALDEIAAELRNQYNIGYYPTHEMKDGKWHRIEIRAKDRRYHVRARKEYFGK